MIFTKPDCVFITVWIFACGILAMTEAHFNLFMNKSETMRLLGVSDELYYVRNGVVNDYALSFNLPIRSEMTDIFFNWQAVNLSPSQQLSGLSYSLMAIVSNPMALSQPSINIPKEGQVPKIMSVIRIRLTCSGLAKAEVDVRIMLNVTLYSMNATCVEIRRKKMCLKGFPDTEEVVDVSDEEQRLGNQWEQAVSQADPHIPLGDSNAVTFGGSQVFYIGVGSTCGAILLLTCSVLLYYLYVKRTNPNEHLSYSTSTMIMSHDRVQLKGDSSSRSTVSGAALSLKQGATPVAVEDLSPFELQESLKEIAVDAGLVSTTKVLFEGCYGCTYLGKMSSQVSDQSPPLTVFIKTLKDEASVDEEYLLMRSGCLTKGLRHPNICSILAAVISPSSHPLLIYPINNEENLKVFLHRCNISHLEFLRVLSSWELVYIAIQIAKGIRYLHQRKIVHCDIATRNCLIDSVLNVKVMDGALSADLFPLDYQSLGESERLPVKWLSVEALEDRSFTPSSDSWAFGVTLWELVTLAQQPFAEVEPVQMLAFLKTGHRMSQPVNCPNKLFRMMAWCWSLCPAERPRLSQLLTAIEELYAGLGHFV